MLFDRVRKNNTSVDFNEFQNNFEQLFHNKLHEITLNEDFLFARKVYLENLKESKNYSDILLDPDFALQPLPSIDICSFNIDKNIWDAKMKPLRVAKDLNHDNYGIMIGFFSEEGIICKNDEYFFCEISEKTLIYLRYLVNTGKSCGIINIKKRIKESSFLKELQQMGRVVVLY